MEVRKIVLNIENSEVFDNQETENNKAMLILVATGFIIIVAGIISLFFQFLLGCILLFMGFLTIMFSNRAQFKNAMNAKNDSYYIINNGAYPYLAEDGSVCIFTEEKNAKTFCQLHRDEKLVHSVFFTKDYLKSCAAWYRCGITTIRYYEDINRFTTEDFTDELFSHKTENLTLNAAKAITNVLQNKFFDAEVQLKKVLDTTPLLVPVGTSEEDEEEDGILHMTDSARKQFSTLLKEVSDEELENHGYLGMDHLTVEPLLCIRNNEEILYYGSETHKDEKERTDLNCLTVTNNSLRQTRIPVFTDMVALKEIFPSSKVSLYTFEELLKCMEAYDGLVINPGFSFCSYTLNKENLDKFEETKEEV